MKIQITKWGQAGLIFTLAAFIVLSTSASTAWAQKSITAKYPKPDFSAMAEYWDVTESEYDYTKGGVGEFYVVAKKKQDKVPRYWVITWRDAQGVKVSSFTLMFEAYSMRDTKIGDPIRGSSYAPEQIQIPKIKSVIVTEHGDSPWAGIDAFSSDSIFAAVMN